MEYKWFSYVPQRNGIATKRSAVGFFESLQRKRDEYMDDMQVYIANLGKYNEGEIGRCVVYLSIDFEEVKEKIGLNDG